MPRVMPAPGQKTLPGLSSKPDAFVTAYDTRPYANPITRKLRSARPPLMAGSLRRTAADSGVSGLCIGAAFRTWWCVVDWPRQQIGGSATVGGRRAGDRDDTQVRP